MHPSTKTTSIPHIDRGALLGVTRQLAHHPGTVLLYSGGSLDSAQRSFLCLFPYDVLKIQGRTWTRSGVFPAAGDGDPWEVLERHLEFDSTLSFPKWVGFFGYEVGAFSDSEKKLPYTQASTPDVYLQRCAVVVVVEHATEQATLYEVEEGISSLKEEEKQWVERLKNPSFWTTSRENLPVSQNNRLQPETMGESYASYAEKIERAKELIRAGDIYQVNLSQQFVFQGTCEPFALFEKLAQLNPAPFSAYMYLESFTIVSSSPERLVCKRGSFLETRPIKGTMPRGGTAEEDEELQRKLLSSEKERAELLMITDLMRHDLGRVSVPGSVKVPEIWRCEPYTNVFHLLSIIQSQAIPGLSPVDIFRSCFPAGSITGCPKLRAMEVIAELEQRPRGIYTGSIGYFASNGDFDFNVAIRTILIEKNRLTVQLGGAIVYDSDPRSEYEETLHKGLSIFKVLGCNLR